MRRRLQNLVAVILAGLWGAFIWTAHARGHLAFLDRVEAAVTDFGTILRGVKPPPDEVTIVEIDDALVKQAGSFPLPRLELGRVVQAIARLRPRVIALDILLLDKGSDEGDDAVADALGAGPTVIAGAALFPESRQSIDVENRDDPIAGLPRAERFLLPLKKFSDRAQIGIVNLGTDRTGTPRSMPMLFRTSDSVEMSLPLRVAALATGSNPTIEPHRLTLGQRSIPTDSDCAAPIVFYGPRRTIRTISARSLLAGEADPAAIENRIVVLGATVTGGGDFFSTPFEPVMPGVEVVSTAIAQLVSGDTVRRDRSVRIVDGLTTVLLPMLLVGMLAWRRSTAGILAAAAVGLGWIVRDLAGIFIGSLAGRGLADRRHGAAGRSVRSRSALVRPTAGAVFCDEEPAARAIPGSGHSGVADPRSPLPCRASQSERRDHLHRPVRVHLCQ